MATWTVTGIPRRCAVAMRLRSAQRAFAADKVRADRLTKPLLLGLGVPNHLVQDSPGLFRHPKSTGPQRFVDVLRGDACKRDLEVVNHACAVHGKRRDVATLHQVDEHGRHACLDHMRADAPDDAGVACARIDDGPHDATKILAAENAGQRVEPLP